MTPSFRKTREPWLTLGVALYALAVVLPLLVTDLEAPPGTDASPAGATVLAGPALNVASLYYDDGFYYLRIAQQIATGRGSTLDGRHPTNGYHPLWLGALVPWALVLPGTRGLLLASFLLQALAAAWTAAWLFGLARRFLSRPAALLAVAVWIRIQTTYWMSWSGMEYGLQALAVVALLGTALDLEAAGCHSRRRYLALGILAAVAGLARLDNFLLAALLGLAVLIQSRRPEVSKWAAAVYAAPVVATLTAYLLLNQWVFDRPWPVSAGLKRAWSAGLLAADPVYLDSGWLAAKAAGLLSLLTQPGRAFGASLVVGALAGGALALWALLRRRTTGAAALWPAGAFAALQLLAYTAWFHGGYGFQPWYYVAPLVVTSLLAGAGLELGWRALGAASPARRLPPLLAAAALGIVLLSTASGVGLRRERQQGYSGEPFYAAARWARDQLPADAVVGAWNSGTLAYLSGRRVLNLDGLVNSQAFYRQDRHHLCAYLDREGVGWVIDVFESGRPLPPHSDQLAGCGERLVPMWEGPAYPGAPVRRAVAFRWSPP